MKPYRDCSCRDPVTGRPYGRGKCPRLAQKGHGGWYARFEAPPGPDGKRRQPRIGQCDTQQEAKDALIKALGQVQDRRFPADRKITVGAYLTGWLEDKKPELKPRTWASYEEAVRLYLVPGLGHVKLADLKDRHIRALYAAMRKINRPGAEADRDELLRRLLAARAVIPHLPGHLWGTKPLNEGGIKRRHSVLVAAMSDAVERGLIAVNPASTIRLKVPKARPVLWSAARIEQWRKDRKRPAAVMVWDAAVTGQFLDSIEGDRLYPLYHLATYWGMRRQELVNLTWADTDLATRRLHVHGDVKSEDSDRIVIVDAGTAEVLKNWRDAQAFEALEWGDAWTDSGRVFTRENGEPLRPAYVSEHFAVLIRQAGLPPVRFHDLRHGSASLLMAAGQPPKVVSEIMGHSTVSFTMDTYEVVAEELAEAAAVAIEAFVPRRNRTEAAQ